MPKAVPAILTPRSSRSSAIDTRKDSGVNLGRKPEVSTTSGGIGVTHEVGNIGGLSVTGGVSVDVSPINLDISGAPNYEDPSQSTISIGGGAEIPGGILGIGGGVTINTSTGKIEGGSIGGEVLGIGVNISKDSSGVGLGISWQIPFTPITLELGFEFPKKEPRTRPSPGGGSTSDDDSFSPKNLPSSFDSRCRYSVSVLLLTDAIEFVDCIGYMGSDGAQGYVFRSRKPAPGTWAKFGKRTKHPTRDYYEYEIVPVPEPVGSAEIRQLGYNRPIAVGDLIPGGGQWVGDGVKIGSSIIYAGSAYYYSSVLTSNHNLSADQVLIRITAIQEYYKESWKDFKIKIDVKCPGDNDWQPLVPNNNLIIDDDDNNDNNDNNNNNNPPFPNPPPRKKMDTCCSESIKLLRELRIYHRENLRLLGRPLKENGLAPIPSKGFLGEEIERVETPINPKDPNKTTKIKFNNYYEMAQYFLKQMICEDVANDPRSFNRPGGYVQNPNYQRDSEQSLKSNTEPKKDKSGNKRLLKINDNSGDGIPIFSISQREEYIFEALRRFEYLFPSGELSDAKFSKNLLMPGQKGDIKIHNMIHFQEILVQYLSAILGDPREPVYLKDSNPAKPGDQEIKLSHMSISHLIREMYKFVLDTEGDVDALMMMGLRDFRTNLANRIQIIQVAEMVTALFEDSGMLEKQDYIKVALEGDPYAGQWKPGKGFDPDPELDKDTEEATEKILQATLNNFEVKIKVSRRHNSEKTDIRDLLVQLAKTFMRQNAIPATEEAVQKAIESEEFKVKVDMALMRQQIKVSSASSRPRTRRKGK